MTIEQPSAEEKRNISRRDAIKKIVWIGGTAILGASVIKIAQQIDKHEKENTHTGEGIITKKEKKTMPSITTGNPGYGWQPDHFLIYIKTVDGKEGFKQVTEEDYNLCNSGDKVIVEYVSHDTDSDIEIKRFKKE